MPRITNSDQIALALQARLQKLRRRDGPAKASAPESVERPRADTSETLAMIADDDDLSEPDRLRRMVSRMLADEFGGDIVNDPRFTSIVKRVSEMIATDETGQQAFDQALQQLRSG